MITRTVSKNARTTLGDRVNDLQKAGTKVAKTTISNIVRNQGLKSYSVTLLNPLHVQARLKFAWKHLDDSEADWENGIWSDETKIDFFFLVTTPLGVFGGERILSCIQRTPSLLLSIVVERSCFGAVFLQRDQDDWSMWMKERKNEWGHVSTDLEWKRH